MELLKKYQLRGQVRLVGDGVNELLSFEEAWTRAEEVGLDLCLVGQGDVPTVRILDFKKAEYEKKKSQKKSPKTETKEIQFKVNISDHDLETKLRKVKELVEDKQRVRLLIKLKGREPPARAADLLNRILEKIGQFDSPPKIKKIPGGAMLE